MALGTAIMKEAPQEAFMLAMHARVVELEGLAAKLDRRVPELPATGFKIRHSEGVWGNHLGGGVAEGH